LKNKDTTEVYSRSFRIPPLGEPLLEIPQGRRHAPVYAFPFQQPLIVEPIHWGLVLHVDLEKVKMGKSLLRSMSIPFSAAALHSGSLSL